MERLVGNRVRKIVKFKNSAFILFFQLVGTGVQLIYGAFTSRLVAAEEFGNYATCLALIAIFSIIFGAGFTEEAIVSGMDPENSFRKNVSSSVLASVGGCLATIALGGCLFLALNIPYHLIVPTALMVMLVPFQNTIMGVYSFKGKFLSVSLTTFTFNCIGFALAAFCIYWIPTATSLLLSPLFSSSLFVCYGLVRFRKIFFPISLKYRHQRNSLLSKKFLLYRAFWFVNSNILRWTLIISGQPSILGNLNRAEVVTAVPVQQIQNAINKPFYVVAANQQSNSSLDKNKFTDSIGSFIFLWATVISMTLPIIDLISTFLLGKNWSPASSLTPWLLLTGAFQIPTVLLSTVLETQKQFTKTYLIEGALLVSQVILVICLPKNDLLLQIAILMLATMALRFFLYVGLVSRIQILNWKRISSQVVKTLVFSVMIYQISFFSLALCSKAFGQIGFLISFAVNLILFLLALTCLKPGRKIIEDFSRVVNVT